MTRRVSEWRDWSGGDRRDTCSERGHLSLGKRQFSHTSGVNEHIYFSESAKGHGSIVVNIYFCPWRMKARLLKEKHMLIEKET